MKKNGGSQKEAIEAYKKILDYLGDVLKKDIITVKDTKEQRELSKWAFHAH